jgi:hypothetical protein
MKKFNPKKKISLISKALENESAKLNLGKVLGGTAINTTRSNIKTVADDGSTGG